MPRPKRSDAFWIQVWVSAEAYTRSGAPAAARPRARTSSPSIARRPARKQTKLAMLPPLTSSPPQSPDSPTSSATQRTVCASISDAIGESSHPPTLGFTVAASRSASAPIGAADEVM